MTNKQKSKDFHYNNSKILLSLCNKVMPLKIDTVTKEKVIINMTYLQEENITRNSHVVSIVSHIFKFNDLHKLFHDQVLSGMYGISTKRANCAEEL